MNRAKKIKATILILITIFLPLSFYTNVNGYEFPEQYSNGLDFSEMFQIVKLHRGELYRNYFVVTNTSDIPVKFKTEIEPLTVIGDDMKDLSFSLNTSETEITKWTQVLRNKEITLEPGEQTRISYVIDGPDDCRLGDQKESIMLTALTPNKFGTLNSTGYVIYAKIIEDEPSSVMPIIIAIVIGVVLLAVICTTIFILKRKAKNKKKRNASKKAKH